MYMYMRVFYIHMYMNIYFIALDFSIAFHRTVESNPEGEITPHSLGHFCTQSCQIPLRHCSCLQGDCTLT